MTNSSLASLYGALLGGGRVTFSTTNNLTFSLVAPLEILADTTLDAATNTTTITLSGVDRTRLFNVHPGVTLTLLNLTLANGLSTNGAAIFNEGTVLATNCVFQNHLAAGPDGQAGSAGTQDFSFGTRAGDGGTGQIGRGGAFFNLGTLHLARCRFTNNRAEGGDGGNGGAGGNGGLQGGRGGDGGEPGLAQGGAIFSLGTVQAHDCTFANNRATAGAGGTGGASGTGGHQDAVPLPGISRGGAPAAGGALCSAGEASFVACTFHTNTVTAGLAADEFTDPSGWGRPGRRGGIAEGGAIANEGTLTLTNCTFAANAATGGGGGDAGNGTQFRGGEGGNGGDAFGGALWTRVHATVVHCTFADGSATGGAGGAAGQDSWDLDPINPRPGRPGVHGGGHLARTGGTLALQNSLVAYSVSGGNGYGGCEDLGHNLSSDNTLPFHASGSLTNTAPLLGDLGDYGGATQTIPLLAGSPAIDAAATIAGLVTDQRGVARPQGAAYDIGAFERPFASIAGRVTRADDSPYPGVVLTLLSATAPPVTTTTDTTGAYRFDPMPGVDLGVYRIVPPTNGLPFDPTYRQVELTSPSQSITGLDFEAGRGAIVSFGFTVDGAFTLRFRGEPLQPARLESADSLGAWEPVGEATTDATGQVDFTDPLSPDAAFRLYRVVVP
ncbi:MAG: hypothetical protein HS113_25140 [Verrucomicrobiales bacterium]|nr:hypothetical protein [Verrucomicrobiales bacterium]